MCYAHTSGDGTRNDENIYINVYILIYKYYILHLTIHIDYLMPVSVWCPHATVKRIAGNVVSTKISNFVALFVGKLQWKP